MRVLATIIGLSLGTSFAFAHPCAEAEIKWKETQIKVLQSIAVSTAKAADSLNNNYNDRRHILYQKDDVLVAISDLRLKALDYANQAANLTIELSQCAIEGAQHSQTETTP